MINLKNCDIVYFVKNSEYNGELRYSMRSVLKNFPHRKIWFVGGLPKGIKPDYYQPVNQSEKPFKDKYDNMQLPSEDQIFVSTTDASFNQGVIGQYIRELFPDPCEYEYE